VRPLARLLIGRPWGPFTEGDEHGERHTTALGRKNPHDVLPGLVTDGYNEQNQRGWRIARRKILLDQNVLLAKNLTMFF
jgi:hypothetical protein